MVRQKLFIWCSALTVMLAPISSAAQTVWHSETATEMVADLPITKPPYCLEPRVVYSVKLPPLKKGDIITAHASFEVTNPQKYLILAGRFIVLGDRPTDVDNLRIGPAAGRNLLPAMRHDEFAQPASYVVPEDVSGKFVNVVTYATTMLEPKELAHTARVEKGYGTLFVQIMRGVYVNAAVKPKPAPVDKKCIRPS